MFLTRDIEKILKEYVKFPVVALLGPRQSGKTTLAKKYFKKHTYLSFEDPAIREFATTDPKGFLKAYENASGLILDEFQYVPMILSYIQLEVDAKQRPGYFVLTGFQNYLMNEKITQSLAGRVGILTLLPFSIHELKEYKLISDKPSEMIIQGGYPRVYTEKILSSAFYASYIHTYIERDVRQLIQIRDLRTFQKFLALCAGRVGQLLNLTDLAVNCGISVPTATKWISVLEAGYIIFLLQPHFNNFNKRVVKTPKLYFYDVGIACELLGISSETIYATSPFKGALFENFIIADLTKQFLNKGISHPLYFWRDTHDRLEVDVVIDRAGTLIPVEIKSSETLSPHFFDTISAWNKISGTDPENNYVIFAGQENQKRSFGRFMSWESSGSLIDRLNTGDQG